jgi:hypothetical protein
MVDRLYSGCEAWGHTVDCALSMWHQLLAWGVQGGPRSLVSDTQRCRVQRFSDLFPMVIRR